MLVLRTGRRRALESRLYGGGSVSAGFGSSGTQTRLTEALEHVGRAVSTKAPATDLRLKLAHAGYFDPSAPTIFIGAQLMLVFLAIPLGGIVALATKLPLLPALCVVVVVVAIFAYVPNVVVSARKSQRRMEVRQQLPDAIDLLEICVSSGMGLDMAWNAVADEFRGVSSILADEMSLCTLEIHLGAPRAQALRNMAERTGVEDISSLVATLVQSEPLWHQHQPGASYLCRRDAYRAQSARRGSRREVDGETAFPDGGVHFSGAIPGDSRPGRNQDLRHLFQASRLAECGLDARSMIGAHVKRFAIYTPGYCRIACRIAVDRLRRTEQEAGEACTRR